MLPNDLNWTIPYGVDHVIDLPDTAKANYTKTRIQQLKKEADQLQKMINYQPPSSEKADLEKGTTSSEVALGKNSKKMVEFPQNEIDLICEDPSFIDPVKIQKKETPSQKNSSSQISPSNEKANMSRRRTRKFKSIGMVSMLTSSISVKNANQFVSDHTLLDEKVTPWKESDPGYTSLPECHVSGLYAPRAQNQVSTEYKLKQKNRTRKEITNIEPSTTKAKPPPQARQEKLVGVGEDRNTRNERSAISKLIDPWSVYFREDERCERGAILNNPLERKIQAHIKAKPQALSKRISLVKDEKEKKKKSAKNKNQSSFSTIKPGEGSPRFRFEQWKSLDDQLLSWRHHLDHGVIMLSESSQPQTFTLQNTWCDQGDTGSESRPRTSLSSQLDQQRNRNLNCGEAGNLEANSQVNLTGEANVENTSSPKYKKEGMIKKQTSAMSINLMRSSEQIENYTTEDKLSDENDNESFSRKNILNRNESKSDTSNMTLFSRQRSEVMPFENEGYLRHSSHFNIGQDIDPSNDSASKTNAEKSLIMKWKQHKTECTCYECCAIRPEEMDLEVKEMSTSCPVILGRLSRNYKFLQRNTKESDISILSSVLSLKSPTDSTTKKLTTEVAGQGQGQVQQSSPSGDLNKPNVGVSSTSASGGPSQTDKCDLNGNLTAIGLRLMKLMATLVVRKEVMSSSNGQTFSTITFSKPDVFQPINMECRKK